MSVIAAVSSLAHFTIWTASLSITLYSFKRQLLWRGLKYSSTVRSKIGLISLFSAKQLHLVFLTNHSYYLHFLNKPLENTGIHFLNILLSLLTFFLCILWTVKHMRSSELHTWWMHWKSKHSSRYLVLLILDFYATFIALGFWGKSKA